MANIKWVDSEGDRLTCQREGCEAEIRCHGLCSKHYQHFYYQSSKNRWF